MGMNSRKATLIAVIGLAGVAIFSVTALATTGGGVVGTTQVRGTLAGPGHTTADRVQFQTKEDADVAVRRDPPGDANIVVRPEDVGPVPRAGHEHGVHFHVVDAVREIADILTSSQTEVAAKVQRRPVGM